MTNFGLIGDSPGHEAAAAGRVHQQLDPDMCRLDGKREVQQRVRKCRELHLAFR
jgi:hypothetical protein